ncbi:MAG: hypothetical protein RL557_803 [archaeon]|jgi:uncharacterized protein (TIRG00374 family)
MRVSWKQVLPIIGIALFIFIIIKIDFFNIINEMKQVNWFFILLAIITILVMFFIQTYKWYAIALLQDIPIPFMKAFEINMISNFYGFVTPSKAGGIIRAEYLRVYTDNKNIGKGLFNFTMDKIFDFTAVIFLTIVFSFVFKDTLQLPIGLFVMLFLAFMLVILFFINKERSRFVLKFFYKRFIPKKYQDQAKITFENFYEHIPSIRYFIPLFILNVISWGLVYLIMYCIGLSLGIPLSFVYYLAILPLGTLVSILPISISGLGTREAVLISLFGLFGVAAAKTFTMSLINIIIVGIIPSVIGIWLVLREKK